MLYFALICGLLVAQAAPEQLRSSYAVRCMPSPDSAEYEDGKLVGPFEAHRVYGAGAESSAGRHVYFVNGMSTDSARAHSQAALLADHLGCRVYLVFNDLTLPVVDHLAIMWDKLCGAGESLNEATDTLVNQIRTQVEAGADVYIVAYSAGSIVTNNAVRHLADTYEDLPDTEHAARMRRVHVLTVASAVFDDDHPLADGWPDRLGSLYNLYDSGDIVSDVFGPGEWGCMGLDAHDFAGHYVSAIRPEMLAESGQTVIQRRPNLNTDQAAYPHVPSVPIFAASADATEPPGFSRSER